MGVCCQGNLKFFIAIKISFVQYKLQLKSPAPPPHSNLIKVLQTDRPQVNFRHFTQCIIILQILHVRMRFIWPNRSFTHNLFHLFQFSFNSENLPNWWSLDVGRRTFEPKFNDLVCIYHSAYIRVSCKFCWCCFSRSRNIRSIVTK